MAKWMISAKKADFAKIAETYGIDPVIARIIRNRDIVGDAQINSFLNGTLDDLYSPRLLYDMEKAVRFVLSKIKEKASIRIIGDYDIDGICAAYILLRGLRECGAVVDTVIPHRIKDGYGLNDALIKEAHDDGIDTIITCDNGIAAASQIEYAKELGMSVIVTDHHEVPYDIMEDGCRREMLPPAEAVIDPKQEKCRYPFKGICGAVVAYKFVQVLLEEYEKDHELHLSGTEFEELLEFAAFATVGDVMELVDENRIIVRYGLKQMIHTKNPGLQALIEVNGLKGKELSAYHIGFVLGPCLNATGRLDTATRALQMLNSNDFAQAVTIAAELKELNDSRKEMTRKGVERAVEMIENGLLREDKVLVVYLEDCHESLAGIIAGRLKEKYHKPVFVLTKGDEGIKGSGRSIESYNMYEQMSCCKNLFTKYGGHKMAAGLSMPEENMEEFRKSLNRNCNLSDEDFVEKVLIDVPMPLSYVKPELVRQFKLLEPFGNGNPKPVFAQKDVHVIQGRILGKNRNVGKYRIKDAQGNEYDMIYFGDLENWHNFLQEAFGKEEFEKLYHNGSVEIAIQMIYYPDINIYQGRESLQFVMQDYKR
ncbi:MAG: single-stranded-DNA-specific exonuclease RecJ [Lachnospiraceae bacterium]|nr:single-stranded-DNA-specific exonuclease RecJ [Lachnospiraceae bacterium]